MGIYGLVLGVLLASIGYLWVPFGSFWTSLGCLLAPLEHPLSALSSFMGIFWASLAPLGCLGALVLRLLGLVGPVLHFLVSSVVGVP